MNKFFVTVILCLSYADWQNITVSNLSLRNVLNTFLKFWLITPSAFSEKGFYKKKGISPRASLKLTIQIINSFTSKITVNFT